jgi:cytochrome c-type biogenesis protein CcmH
MNFFIGIAAFMTLLVVAWMAYPLLRPKNASGISSERINIDIHRDQLKALELDLARGVISQQDFEATRDELQLRLLDDTESYEPGAAKASSSFWTARRTSIAISTTIPVVALAIYMQLGAPQAINPVVVAKSQDLEMQQMIVSLATKLKAEPNNPEGWAMLARSYKVMGRIEEAQQAFVNAGELVYKHPDLMVEYADVLAVRANTLEGKPLELVNKALAMNPVHPMGLMMSAEAAFRRTDYKLALQQWEKVLTQLEPNSPDAQQITANIAEAREKSGLPASQITLSEAGKLPPVPAGAAAGMTPDMINQMVERLANRLKANPDDPAGWEQLARAYTVLGRNDDAQKAQANAKLASTKKP